MDDSTKPSNAGPSGPSPAQQSLQQATIKIYGDVQGVFFRADSREKARELNIKGWIKNEDDGTVSCIAQGPPENLQAFLDWCRRGPPDARVDKLDAKIENIAQTTFSAFTIRY
ncbi:acylphosphatase [Candidatus Gracilibacteria bacterium]|nr:acylphosphatase [Candidatus Gracilibacteria bacterium]